PLLLELETRLREVEAVDRDDPDPDLDERQERRDGAGPEARERHEPDDEGADHRQEDERGRDPGVHRVKRKATARIARPLASAGAYERTRPFCSRRTSREPRPKPRRTSPIEPAINGRSTNREKATASATEGR